ncbi:MAG: diguanylate cyclase [Halieaceae bacterium]
MSRNTGSGLNFVRRIYTPRVFGMALAFPAAAAVLYQQQAPWHFWVFAVFNAFLWPHLAYLVASRSEKPTVAEYRNLMTDSVFAGLWVPLLSFNLLPSLVVLTMASLDNMMVGGWRLFARGLALSLLSIVIGWQWAQFIVPDYSFQLEPSMLTLIATAPLMVVFPLSIGLINFSLSRRLSHQREELERISRTDGLSQLNNRRYWEELVYREYERQKRSGAPLSLVMIDIDHFKQVNDKYGHVAGDQMIREISDLLTESNRTSDVVGRYGGEEFGLLLPDTDEKGALQIAERLRLGVQSLSIKPYNARCTISLGVAEVDASVRKYRQLIEHADKALYLAKRSGRNIAMAYERD